MLPVLRDLLRRLLPKALLSSALVACTLLPGPCPAAPSAAAERFPEQDEVTAVLAAREPPGLLFLVMEQDEEALSWVLPRILHYTGQLRERWPDLPIAVLSHGEEMLALLTELAPLYPAIHRDLYQLVWHYDVSFHICGTFVAQSGYELSEFPDYVDVVPFGPAQIQDYRDMEYKVISVELTW